MRRPRTKGGRFLTAEERIKLDEANGDESIRAERAQAVLELGLSTAADIDFLPPFSFD